MDEVLIWMLGGTMVFPRPQVVCCASIRRLLLPLTL